MNILFSFFVFSFSSFGFLCLLYSRYGQMFVAVAHQRYLRNGPAICYGSYPFIRGECGVYLLQMFVFAHRTATRHVYSSLRLKAAFVSAMTKMLISKFSLAELPLPLQGNLNLTCGRSAP